MQAEIKITVEGMNARQIEDRIQEVAGLVLKWAWTNDGSPNQVGKHVREIEEGLWTAEDGGNGWDASITVEA